MNTAPVLPNPAPARPALGPARFRQQFWMLNNTVRTLGVEWDQARLGYPLGPIRDDRVAADTALIRQA